jgi:hypothetical protein
MEPLDVEAQIPFSSRKFNPTYFPPKAYRHVELDSDN